MSSSSDRPLDPVPDPDPESLVADLIRGAWKTLAARAMAELRIADALVRPTTLDEVAERTGTHAPSLNRLLRTLAALGLVTYREGLFQVTAAGARLRSDVPGSDWGAMMMMPAPWTLATWQHLPDAIRTGEPVFELVHGSSFWDFHRSNEDAGAIFDAAMARGAKEQGVISAVVTELRRSQTQLLVDVGGGTGRLLGQVVAQVPQLHGLLADQRDPVDKAEQVFAAHGVTGRCKATVCDFFQAVPPGGDAYLLSNILHDWDDEASARILTHIRDACLPGGQLLLVESVLPDEVEGVHRDSAQLRLLDLMMLLNFGARERTLVEYRDMLERAGFVDVRLVDAGSRQLIIATRA
jgi:SAM-dependent methyltransferase